MSPRSRRSFLAAACTATGLGIAASQVDGFTKAKITASLSPLPGIRPTGKPLGVQQSIESEDAEYLSKTDEVRFVTARSADGPIVHKTVSFEHWAELKAGTIATERVQRRIEAVFERDTVSGTSSHDGHPFVSTAPTGPAVTRREMVRKLPNHVTTRVTFADQRYTTSIPVVVKKRVHIQSS